jgi:hypothetical protein
MLVCALHPHGNTSGVVIYMYEPTGYKSTVLHAMRYHMHMYSCAFIARLVSILHLQHIYYIIICTPVNEPHQYNVARYLPYTPMSHCVRDRPIIHHAPMLWWRVPMPHNVVHIMNAVSDDGLVALPPTTHATAHFPLIPPMSHHVRV